MGKSADAIATREHVYQQMLSKFPSKAIEWVRTVRWTGPVEIDPTQIDDSGKSSWRASHDPAKVEADRQKNREGRGKPIILVRGPNGKLKIVDGHHRFLAAEQEDRPVRAWVGRIPRDEGPWNETHAYQIGGPSN